MTKANKEKWKRKEKDPAVVVTGNGGAGLRVVDVFGEERRKRRDVRQWAMPGKGCGEWVRCTQQVVEMPVTTSWIG